ncbi:MAG: DUF2905 domain-containing protein [Candidatus Velthaea sp.]
MSPGRAIIALGIAIVVVGAIVEFAPALRLGRLPGDLTFGNQNFRVFVPIGTSLLLSILLTIIVALMNRR